MSHKIKIFIFYLFTFLFSFIALGAETLKKESLTLEEYDFYCEEGEGIYELHFKKMERNLRKPYPAFVKVFSETFEVFKEDVFQKFGYYFRNKSQAKTLEIIHLLWQRLFLERVFSKQSLLEQLFLNKDVPEAFSKSLYLIRLSVFSKTGLTATYLNGLLSVNLDILIHFLLEQPNKTETLALELMKALSGRVDFRLRKTKLRLRQLSFTADTIVDHYGKFLRAFSQKGYGEAIRFLVRIVYEKRPNFFISSYRNSTSSLKIYLPLMDQVLILMEEARFSLEEYFRKDGRCTFDLFLRNWTKGNMIFSLEKLKKLRRSALDPKLRVPFVMFLTLGLARNSILTCLADHIKERLESGALPRDYLKQILYAMEKEDSSPTVLKSYNHRTAFLFTSKKESLLALALQHDNGFLFDILLGFGGNSIFKEDWEKLNLMDHLYIHSPCPRFIMRVLTKLEGPPTYPRAKAPLSQLESLEVLFGYECYEQDKAYIDPVLRNIQERYGLKVTP